MQTAGRPRPSRTFGRDGNLYVSDTGFGFPPGAGQVVRVKVSNHHDEDD